jgi:hypothetical protein
MVGTMLWSCRVGRSARLLKIQGGKKSKEKFSEMEKFLPLKLCVWRRREVDVVADWLRKPL